MHNKILKHLLQLFFVLLLLTILGMQWVVVKKGPSMEESIKEEAEYYRFVMPKHTASPERPNLEVKVY